jgi:MFS family permease
VLNLAVLTLIALATYGLGVLTGDWTQWLAVALGVSAAFCWAQGLSLRDRPTFKMIFGSRALMYGFAGVSAVTFVSYGLGFWFVPYLFRTYPQVSPGVVGTWLGLSGAIGGWLGVTLGGVISDRWKQRTPRARIYMPLLSVALTVPLAFVVVNAANPYLAFVTIFIINIVGTLGAGPMYAVANELVLPRMRATSSAVFILATTLVGMALGPYVIGKISDGFIATGMPGGAALRSAMLIGLSVHVLSVTLLGLACRHLPSEEASRMERARLAGEPS